MSTSYGKFDKDAVFAKEVRLRGETIGAPQWLIDRMEALKKRPPPTVEQLCAQWKASAKFREKNI